MKLNMKQESPKNTGILKDYSYLATLVGLTASMYGINATNKLLVCSMFFILAFVILGAIYQAWGTKKYFQAAAIALVLNAPSLFYQWPLFGILALFAYLARYPAFFLNWWVLHRLENKVTLPWRLLLALTATILLDNAILMIGLLAHYGGAKAWLILLRSIGYKLSYSTIAALSVYAGNKFSQSTRILRSLRVASALHKKD